MTGLDFAFEYTGCGVEDYTVAHREVIESNVRLDPPGGLTISK